jgi:hypothetical protein
MLDPMALAQRARDATMAERMLAAPARPVVLIAGDGHARADRGVPAQLRARSPGARVVAVAFLEVQADARAPGPGPYDYVWYTPRATDEDPCAGSAASSSSGSSGATGSSSGMLAFASRKISRPAARPSSSTIASISPRVVIGALAR